MAVRWTIPPRHRLCLDRRILSCAVVLFLATFYLLASFDTHSTGHGPRVRFQVSSQRELHFLMPADKSDERICKAMFSGLASGYPRPVLVNWGLNKSSAEMNGYDMKAGKIWGVLSYLRKLPHSADDDLVLMSDAYDVWFQLPPDVLLRRYDEANALANERIAQEHGSHDLRQTIIFGAEKFCWPRKHTDPACYAVPQSTLRPDAYGPQTDGKEVKTQRPRFLNSGLIIGPVADMRNLYERVHDLWTTEAPDNHADNDKANDGDQNIFAEVYGYQEYFRQQLRGANDWIFNFGESFDEDSLTLPPGDGRSWEFHIGLDLAGTMFQALNEAHMDLSFVKHADRKKLASLDRKHGTEAIYGAADESFHFPSDLDAIPQKPFTLLADSNSENKLRGEKKSWWQVPLATNFHARTIPVAMHHNGYNRLLKPWWLEMWWSAEKSDAGKKILDRLKDDEKGALTTDGKALSWAKLCGRHQEAVFPPTS